MKSLNRKYLFNLFINIYKYTCKLYMYMIDYILIFSLKLICKIQEYILSYLYNLKNNSLQFSIN